MSIRSVLVSIAILVHIVMVGSILRQPLASFSTPGAARYLGWRLHHDSTRMEGPGVDFFCVYHAGRNAQTGVSMYRPLEVGPNRTPYFFEFRYLPIVGETLGRAFAQLPPIWAYRAWVTAVELLFAAIAVLLYPPRAALGPGLASWLAYVLSTPYFLELHMGQFTFAAASLAALALMCMDGSRARAAGAMRRCWSGLLLTASILLKLFPLALLVPFARRRGFRVFALLIIAAILLATVPGFVANPNDWYDFLDANAVVLPGAGNFGLPYAVLLTAEGFGPKWTLGAWSLSIEIGMVLFGGIGTAIVLFARRRSLLAEGAIMLSALALMSYQIWEHHASAQVLAGLLLVAAIERWHDETRGGDALLSFDHRCAWVAAASAILLALPTVYFLIDPNPKLWTFGDRMALQWTKPLGTLGIYVAGLVWISRDGFCVKALAARQPAGPPVP